ncbi:MAG: DUF4864 domain-containing protein [Gammaproteobacteria bacterium]|nr:DUF4864 domain-containing protein [Gammaproteobacteria bacterium]
MKTLTRNTLLSIVAALLMLPTVHAVEPSTEHSPEQVVQFVVDALKNNRQDLGDNGIELVFQFASPNNKRNTGPIERFKQMIKVGFGDMLNHQATRFGKMQIDDNVALQKVWFLSNAGTEHGYLFRLGKQTFGEFEGMWMTDAVYPLKNQPSGQSI